MSEDKSLYAAINALIGDSDQLFYVSSQHQHREKITPGYYGLSNAGLDTPWPKVKILKKNLKTITQLPFTEPSLWALLTDKKQAETEKLPNTGISRAREKLLSSIFIESGDYGTRSSYILTQTKQLVLKEKIYSRPSNHTKPVL